MNHEAKLFWANEHARAAQFKIPLKDRLAKRVTFASENLSFAQPRQIVELGAGTEPITALSIASLITRGTNPRVILNDLAYSSKEVQNAALRELQAGLSQYNMFSQIGRTVFASDHITFSDTPIEDFDLPMDMQDIHLAFCSVANYVSFYDLQRLIQTPSVRSVSFLNNGSAGADGWDNYFHRERPTSQQLRGFLLRQGFIESIYVEGISRNAPAGIEPVVGGLYVKARNDEESYLLANQREAVIVDL